MEELGEKVLKGLTRHWTTAHEQYEDIVKMQANCDMGQVRTMQNQGSEVMKRFLCRSQSKFDIMFYLPLLGDGGME